MITVVEKIGRGGAWVYLFSVWKLVIQGKATCKELDGEGTRETIPGFPQHIITCNPPFSL